MITLADYFMGRDHGEFSDELTDAMRRSAEQTVKRVNSFLDMAAACGVTLDINPSTGTLVSSGWRPLAVNKSIPAAAPKSKHMSCEACDIYDPDGDLDDWAMGSDGQAALMKCGLWLEHPSATKGWSHLQILPPRSGKRVFYP